MADEIQNIKIRIVADADFSQLDQSLNKLTAEEKQLNEQLKAVDASAKAANKSIQTEAQNSAAAVNKTNQSFDNLRDKVKGVAQQIPGAFQVEQILSFSKGISGAVGGVGSMSSAMGVLKVAIASTGIGALVIALGSLVAYFTQTDEGATRLQGIMGALGSVVKSVTGFFAEFGGKLFDAFSSVENFQQAISDLGEAIKENLINRIKSVLVLGDAIQLLFEGKFAEAAKKAADAQIQFTTGIENGIEKLEAWGDQIAKDAKAAYEFAIAMDAIDDAQRELNVTLAENEKQVTNLIIQAKNRSLSDQERIGLFQKANKLEEDGLNSVLDLERKRLALLQERNAREKEQINQRTQQALAEAKTAKEINEIKQKQNSINDDLADEEAKQREKIIHLETESMNLIERNQNRIDALLEQRKAKNEAAAKAKQQLLDKEAKAAEDAAKREADAFEKLIEFRIGLEIKKNDDISKDEKKSVQDRINAVNDRILKEQELLEAERDYAINVKKLTGSEALLVEEQFQAKQNELINKGQKEKADIYAKDKAAHDKAEDEKTKKEEDEQKKRTAKFVQTYNGIAQLTSTIVNGIFDLRKANNEAELSDLDKKHQAELQKVGDNKQAQDVINKKFAVETAKIKNKEAQDDRKQALFNIGLNTASAIVHQLAATPLPAGLPLIALVAATGATQLAFAASKPVPKFNKGTKSVPGYDGGDDSVVAMLRPGEGVMPVDRMKDYQPAFDAIFDRKVPAGFINSMVMDYDRLGKGIPVSSNSDLSGLRSELKGLRQEISKLQILQVNMDQKGFKAYISSGESKSQIENNYTRIR